MYIVMTKVQLKPETAEDCARMFEETNPPLVKSEQDWLGAQMLVNREENQITVLATWRDLASYRHFSASDEFRNTMQGFAPYFQAPPEISTHELLVEMKP